jgi:hypothetical protein
MDPISLEASLQQSATSGATGSTSVPFVNNGELIIGSDSDLSGSGITGSNPSASGSVSPGVLGTGSAVGASGNSAVLWISVAGIVVALLLALRHTKI